VMDMELLRTFQTIQKNLIASLHFQLMLTLPPCCLEKVLRTYDMIIKMESLLRRKVSMFP
jgi:hypothetical protein